MAYMPGDMVVHPQHGTATVEGLTRRDIGKGPEDYLELHVENRSLKVLVPAGTVEACGIRNISTRDEAEVILALLSEPSDVPEGWVERNTLSSQRVKSHDLAQLSMVVRDLSRRQSRGGKSLAMGERNLLEGCLDLLAREFSLALELTELEARTLILEKARNLEESLSEKFASA